MADKEAIIVLRMSAELKATITAAAEQLGLPLTTFITDAALKRAQHLRQENASGTQGVKALADFRVLCKEAVKGTADGYATPGWHLAALVGTQRPADIDHEAWSRQVDALNALLANRDDEATWAWFQQHYPDCMALIPPRRREQFLYGVRRAYEQDLINA
jgi:hypothetical protein